MKVLVTPGVRLAVKPQGALCPNVADEIRALAGQVGEVVATCHENNEVQLTLEGGGDPVTLPLHFLSAVDDDDQPIDHVLTLDEEETPCEPPGEEETPEELPEGNCDNAQEETGECCDACGSDETPDDETELLVYRCGDPECHKEFLVFPEDVEDENDDLTCPHCTAFSSLVSDDEEDESEDAQDNEEPPSDDQNEENTGGEEANP